MHRLIMQSSTYRMSSRFNLKDQLARDPDNRYLWRHSRRRIEGESLWDAVHATAGTLTVKLGGPPVAPPLAADEIASLRNHWQWTGSADLADHTRRGMYILVRRNFRFPMFELFDAPINSVSCPKREVTTVPTQALWSLNNKTVVRQAGHMAARVIKDAGDKPETWVERAWWIALSRPPRDDEKTAALQLLESLATESQTAGSAAADSGLMLEEKRIALEKLCLALYNLNEFSFVD